MVVAIYNRFMPDTDLNKPRIHEECSGLAIQTTGIPCIHILLRAERGSGLSVANFHPHWHLLASAVPASAVPASTVPASTVPESTWNPPIPASQVQNPRKAITRGRPPISSARQAISQTQRSTQRSPSQFEIAEQQIIASNQAFEVSRAESRAVSRAVSRAASQASQLSGASGAGGASQASGASGASVAGWEASEDEGPRRSGRAPRPKRKRTDETSQGETTETDY
jgi:hypothetical protein